MSAVEMIVAALAAGASVGMKDTASVAVKDAYNGLRDLLKHRLAGQDGELVEVLEANQSEPVEWQARFGDALTAAGADRDERILDAARRLLELADPTGSDPTGSTVSKYRVDAREAKGLQVGDHTTQHNSFS